MQVNEEKKTYHKDVDSLISGLAASLYGVSQQTTCARMVFRNNGGKLVIRVMPNRKHIEGWVYLIDFELKTPYASPEAAINDAKWLLADYQAWRNGEPHQGLSKAELDADLDAELQGLVDEFSKLCQPQEQGKPQGT